MDTFKNFHSHGVFEKKLNTPNIALIPKKTGAKDLRGLKPISLIRSMCKLLPKVLTETLKRAVHKLVDVQHMPFIKERQIMDVLIANGVANSKSWTLKRPMIMSIGHTEVALMHKFWRKMD